MTDPDADPDPDGGENPEDTPTDEALDTDSNPSRVNGNGDEDGLPLDIVDHGVGDAADSTNGAEDVVDAPPIDGQSRNGDGNDDLVSDLTVTEEADRETEEGEVEPVELLVQMADDGEIDPWAIDIVAVTDEFLARLDESDLRTGGRALFYASVLLRMKSDALLVDDEPDEGWEESREGPMDDPRAEAGSGLDPFEQLEREMERRLERKRARGMPRTLDELVRELRERERESYWKEHREYDTSDSPRGFGRGTQTLDYHTADDLRMDDEPTEADVTGTAHAEHMEDIITDVHGALRDQYDAGREEVLYAEIEDAGGSRVETFLALLFLAQRGQIRLRQDEFFGDLWVQDPATIPPQGEAVAD